MYYASPTFLQGVWGIDKLGDKMLKPTNEG